jgi:V/A-type H+-transporting ATPase subunit D
VRKRAEPTKANLIRLRREAAFARQGLEILDRKREILMRELARKIAEYGNMQSELRELLTALYGKSRDALAAIGPRAAGYETVPLKGIAVKAKHRRVMGVKVPTLTLESSDIHTHTLAPRVNAAAKELAAHLEEIISFIEISCAMRRIAGETSKTRKREKAIEEIHLPSYEREITRISESLDENEREELVRYKALKRRLG